jgi:Short C-terminal domain
MRLEHKASRETHPPPTPQPSSPSPDFFEQLKKLADLRDAGVLTQEEFQAKKG